MKFTTLFSAAVLLTGSTAMAQLYNSFVNCVTPGSVPAGQLNIAGAASSDDCITECLKTDLRYAYYTTSSNLLDVTVGEPACVCSPTQPDVLSFTRTVDTLGDFTCNTATDYQSFLLRTTNRFDGCSRGGGDTDGITLAPEDEVKTLEQCLTYCAAGPTFNTIYFQVRTDSPEYPVRCFCQIDAFPEATRCGTGNENDGEGNYYTMFRRTPGAVASGGLRRRSKGFRCDNASSRQFCDTSFYQRDSPQLTLGGQEYCPAGKTACNVAGQSGAYECLDTNTELESCGGCMAGEFGKNGTTPGVDCYTQFPKSVQNRITCSSGSCLLY